MSDQEIENFIKKEKSLKERIKYFLESENLSDFKCLVGKDGPEQRAVPCHKFVFAIASYEFYNLFHNLSSTETVIKLPEICYTSFKQFVRYVYTEEITLSHKNIIEIWILARRFQIEHLTDFCLTELRRILQKNKDVDFIQQILKNNFIFRSVESKFFLNEIIGKNPLKYLNDKNIGVLRRTDLEIILKTSKSEVKETDYFQTAILWAKNVNSNKNLTEGLGLILRSHLRDLVKLIRFPAMTSEDFHTCLKEYDGFLTTDEIFEIFFFITEKKGVPTFESESREGKLKSKPKIVPDKPEQPQCSILSIIDNKGGSMQYGNFDYLCLRANKTVKFLGVGIQLSTEALYKVQKAEIEICLRDRSGDVVSKTIKSIDKSIDPSFKKMVLKQRFWFTHPVILSPDVSSSFSARIRILEGYANIELGCGVPNLNLGVPYNSDGIIFNLHKLMPNYFITEILYEKI